MKNSLLRANYYESVGKQSSKNLYENVNKQSQITQVSEHLFQAKVKSSK